MDGLIEVRDNEGKMIGYRCSVCNRFFGLNEHVQASDCLEHHRTLLVEG